MAWKRTAFRGTNSAEVASVLKQGDGAHVKETAIDLTASNKLAYPGAISFNNMSGTDWDSTFTNSATFKTTITTGWFRDAGSTTT